VKASEKCSESAIKNGHKKIALPQKVAIEIVGDMVNIN
jgi:hypothetical protein